MHAHVRTCACVLIVRSLVPLRQPEDGQYRPKHVVVHYIDIKYTSCDTVVFDYIQFSKSIRLCLLTVCFLEFQYLNPSNEGDSIFSLARWTFIPLF